MRWSLAGSDLRALRSDAGRITDNPEVIPRPDRIGPVKRIIADWKSDLTLIPLTDAAQTVT